MSRTIVIKGHEQEFEYNEKKYFSVSNVELEIDNAYGADIDGNRGISAVFITDLEILSVLDEKDREVTDEAIKSKAEDVIVDNEWNDYL